MSKIFEKAAHFLRNLDSRQFTQFCLGTVAAIFVLAGLIVFGQLRTFNKMKREFASVNQARETMQKLLDRADTIQEQKKRVEEILDKEKDFKLLQYVHDVANRLGLQSNLKVGVPTVSDLENLSEQGYEEVRIEIELANLNTRQLVDLLTEFEQKERIDLKMLTINHPSRNPTIDVQLVISTIESKAPVPEEA